MKKGTIDRTDLQILKLLREDGRLSLREVSKKLGKAQGTVMKRVTDMQNEGILKRFTIILDLTKLGYVETAVILVQTDNRVDYVKNTIAKMPNVISIYHITGDFDIVLTAKFKDNSEISTFVSQLLSLNGIRRIIPGMALDVIKEETTALCEVL